MWIDREDCIGCGKCFPGKEVRQKAVKDHLTKKDLTQKKIWLDSEFRLT